MKGNRVFVFAVIFFMGFVPDLTVQGQCLYHSAKAGSDTAVTFTLSGGSFQSYGCAPIDPTYWVAGFGATMTMTFTTPQTNPSVRVWGMNDDDSASVSVNGVAYPLTSSSASYDPKVVCGLSPGPDGVIFVNGKVVGANSNVNGNYSYQDVIIKATGVTSIQVKAISGAGWGFVGVSTGCSSPLVAHFTSSDTAFCDEGGKCIDFFDHSTGNPTSWTWSFPGATPNSSNQQNPTGICYYFSGTYAVSLIVSNSVGTDTLIVSPMIVYPFALSPPIISINGIDSLCADRPGYFYQWYLDGTPITGATEQCYVATICGFYNVQIKDSIFCGYLSSAFNVPCVGINAVALQSVSVYPNPAFSQITVSGLPSGGEATIEIFDMPGKKVYSYVPNNKPATVMDVSSLAKGVYFLQLKTDRETVVKRIVKE